MQNGQKHAVSTSTSVFRKRQTDVFLLNGDDEVYPSLLVTKEDVKQYFSGGSLNLHTTKT